MDITSTPPSPDSPATNARKSISAFFTDREKAEAAVQDLKTAGVARDEIRQDAQDGGYVVSVANEDGLSDFVSILQHHGGTVPQADLDYVAESESPAPDPDDEPAETRLDSDTNARSAGVRRRGIFSRGSGSGGSGSGTATGGSLFGSAR